jgi:purine-cytosine permease-like protein
MSSSIEPALLWFTLALVNAGIAQGKGRRGLSWFLWSLLFGVFATLVLVVRPRATEV